MNYDLIVLPAAWNEIEEAIEWYESRKTGLGIQFFEHLDLYFELLKKNIANFQVKRKPNIRELPLKTFPYIIIYEVFENKIVIYSIFNTNQNPLRKIK